MAEAALVGVVFGGELDVPPSTSAFRLLLRVTILFGDASLGIGLSGVLLFSSFDFELEAV